MRKKKSRFFISLLVITLILGLCAPSFAAPKEMATAVYYNGPIITVDKNMSNVQAVAVKGDKIMAVGNLGKIMQYAGKDTKHVNLQGKTMLPGFYDAHGHFPGFSKAVQLQSPPIGTIKNIDELVAALTERAKITESGDWIRGSGYDDGELAEKRHPTCKDLDKVSTEIPILITHFSGHNSVANTKAMEIAGLTANTPNPPGGEIGKFADGTLNGQLWETASRLVSQFAPANTHQDRLDAITEGCKIYTAKGVTTANVGAGANFDLYKEAYDKGYLNLRTTLWFNLEDAKKAHDQFGSDRGINKYYGDKELVVLAGIKYFQDGSPQLRTAHLTDPYYTTGEWPSDWVAYPRYPQEEITQMVVDAHEAGFNQIYIHTNGDAAIDYVLNAYEEIRKPQYRQPADPSDLRHTLIHCQFSREDQFDRMKELGVLPSFLMLHTYYLGDRHWTTFFGPERSSRMSATKDAVIRDLPFTLHCDTNVFPHDPLLLMWSAVNRLSYTGREIFTETYDPDSKYRSVDQRITPEEALRGITINSAYENGEENITGSIEVGKRADFVILEENPLKIDPLHIKDIQIAETIVGGETVFKADGEWSPGNQNRNQNQK